MTRLTQGQSMDAPDEWPLTAERLCARYAPRVYRFAAMVAAGDVEAEDLAQDAMVRAIRNLGRFDTRRGSVETWLWRIVVNAAIDAGRVSTRRRRLWERFRSQPATAENVEDLALMRITAAELLTAVRRLRPRERGMIALRFGAGLGFADVGAAYGISPAAATMATRRALDTLRTLLKETR
ncbi:MAG: sigma-70 family RNA polymerase sigma factor [Chloroflexi bacterium]|nr:MAG: sigma-70 family RNA polymerase sigma factor [Chloroflexota bacterium]